MDMQMFNHAYRLYIMGVITQREMEFMIEEAADYRENRYEFI